MSARTEKRRQHNANILKSQAMRAYSSDLDSIWPASDSPNPHGGPSRMQTFNVLDVMALDARLALKEYELASCQLDRIQPISEAPNPKGPRVMRFYNVIDVMALSDGIRTAAAAPTGPV
ncbi:hypothetical protein C8J57DRAFT_1496773 [Mycena rebaudengoi]|nr:hypothetical protein C8J57DRAFT_1496773 [Mycena rebaudengoi]